MTPFHRRGDGTIAVRLTENERALLGRLAAGLVEVLRTHDSGEQRDPALARLLPDGYRDDSEAAAEFRRFTEEELVAGKESRARGLAALFGSESAISLTAAQASQLLRTLTDLRIVLADRLQIEQDGDEGPAGSEFDATRSVYFWLGVLQESLVDALDG